LLISKNNLKGYDSQRIKQNIILVSFNTLSLIFSYFLIFHIFKFVDKVSSCFFFW